MLWRLQLRAFVTTVTIFSSAVCTSNTSIIAWVGTTVSRVRVVLVVEYCHQLHLCWLDRSHASIVTAINLTVHQPSLQYKSTWGAAQVLLLVTTPSSCNDEDDCCDADDDHDDDDDDDDDDNDIDDITQHENSDNDDDDNDNDVKTVGIC